MKTFYRWLEATISEPGQQASQAALDATLKATQHSPDTPAHATMRSLAADARVNADKAFDSDAVAAARLHEQLGRQHKKIALLHQAAAAPDLPDYRVVRRQIADPENDHAAAAAAHDAARATHVRLAKQLRSG